MIFDKKKRIAILGATGSIGRQTLDVVRQHADEIEIVALSAHSSVRELIMAAHEFHVDHIAFSSKDVKDNPGLMDMPSHATVGIGHEALLDIVHLPEVDIVVNALVGAAGLRASYETLKLGKVLALANKESLVVGGDILMPLTGGLKELLLPVDSEHSAIFQCLEGEDHFDIYRIWLTASGGPFFGKKFEELEDITPMDALAHPNWSMGNKISIDSATLVNKGLEAIEAKHLFNIDFEQIKIVIQRQSAIHSMVEFQDGSIKAHLGATDMRIPIQYALSYPNRWETPAERVDFAQIAHLDFYDPDYQAFPALSAVLEAGKKGGTLPAAMNAANEVAVNYFLKTQIGFNDIARVVTHAVEHNSADTVESIDQLEAVDKAARLQAQEFIRKLMR
ncbi:MAG: 1-deoxy-D-xylulose-5-phosphate reductoisomerase [Coriobacteriia bacterium]|nr:1-deoxy-D-xylulose-5-phosphate reductoisomerase [Coriobacteriia bacterium]